MSTLKNKTTPAGQPDKALRVVARSSGFRRAGYEFGSEPTDINLSDITPEQREQLMSEPMLVVMEIDIAPPAV